MQRNIGAEIMGRNKFGPERGPWKNHEWKEWWGDTPPFHTPVFVLSHHGHPSFTLADTMHIAVAPTELGRGERLWSSLDELLDRFHLESVPSPSGVTHLLFWRK